MRKIKKELINRYREDSYRITPKRRIKSKNLAIEYVNQRGFIYFWPIKDIILPSLWVAVAGDRPVAEVHDDPGHVTWGWKDSLLGGDDWYYAKVLRKKATIISFDTAPYFYALTENYGSPEEDYLTIYEQGKMTQEAKIIYETLLKEGPLDTVSLRKISRLSRQESASRFDRALAILQADFKVCPVAVTEAGAWRYAFVYDIVPRHYPDIPEQARFIQENVARQKLCELYFRSVGAARIIDVTKLFQWQKRDVQKAIDQIASEGEIFINIDVEDSTEKWIVHKNLLEDGN